MSEESHFPIQNLPYGVFSTDDKPEPRIGVAIGDYVLDLSILEEKGYFKEMIGVNNKIFNQPSLNEFMN